MRGPLRVTSSRGDIIIRAKNFSRMHLNRALKTVMETNQEVIIIRQEVHILIYNLERISESNIESALAKKDSDI